MTIKQKQHLLGYLGYYQGVVNGKWGRLSMEATEAFQNDYLPPADGIFGPGTEKRILEVISSGEAPVRAEPEGDGTFWDEIKYFTRQEFACKCGKCGGFPVEPDETMVKYANAIRERLGVPLVPNSGIRCKQHNANVGGVKNSQHVLGNACDLGAPKGVAPEKMARVAEEVIGNTGGIGIYSWGIHIDSRPIKARWNG